MRIVMVVVTLVTILGLVSFARAKKQVPCGTSFKKRIHEDANCVLFFLPQDIARRPKNHLNCCFGKWKKYNEQLKQKQEVKDEDEKE